MHGAARQAHVQQLIHQLGLQKVSQAHAFILCCFQSIVVENAGNARMGVAFIMSDCSFCRKCMHCMQCDKGGSPFCHAQRLFSFAANGRQNSLSTTQWSEGCTQIWSFWLLFAQACTDPKGRHVFDECMKA